MAGIDGWTVGFYEKREVPLPPWVHITKRIHRQRDKDPPAMLNLASGLY